MEDFITEMWEDRDGRKNMSKNNSKSLSCMRQKLRKYLKDFEVDLAKFRENPDQPDDEKKEIDIESDDESIKMPSKLPENKGIPLIDDGGDSSDTDDRPSDSETSTDDSDYVDKVTSMRELFLKKTGPAIEDDEEKERKKDERRKERQEKDRKKARKEDEEDGEGEWETVSLVDKWNFSQKRTISSRSFLCKFLQISKKSIVHSLCLS